RRGDPVRNDTRRLSASQGGVQEVRGATERVEQLRARALDPREDRRRIAGRWGFHELLGAGESVEGVARNLVDQADAPLALHQDVESTAGQPLAAHDLAGAGDGVEGRLARVGRFVPGL